MKMKHIVSFSGGKDSTAMLIKMIEKGMQIDEVVFADTTLELPEMYEYIGKIESRYSLNIKRITPKKSFDNWFFGKVTRGAHEGKTRGWPPANAHCYWSREVKDKALKKYTKGNIVYMGIALDEAKRICDYPDFTAKYPLVDWMMTEKDCFNFLSERGLLNPLYESFTRTGCYLCPKQSLRSLSIVFKDYPLLWDKIKEYDEQSDNSFRSNESICELERRV